MTILAISHQRSAVGLWSKLAGLNIRVLILARGCSDPAPNIIRRAFHETRCFELYTGSDIVVEII